MIDKDFTIKRAVEEDVELIFQFVNELAIYEKLEHEVEATVEDIRLNMFGAKPVAEAIIAYYKNTPIGFALYFYNFSTFVGKPGIYLEDLFVKPECRGKGFGKALLVKLAQIAKENNCGRVEWTVLDWNTPSIEFYKSLGADLKKEWIITRMAEPAIKELADNLD